MKLPLYATGALAGIGAMAGLAISPKMYHAEPTETMAAGAAVGASIGVIGTAAAYGAYGVGSALWNNADTIVDGAWNVTKKVGTGLAGAAYRVVAGPELQGGRGAAAVNTIFNPLNRYAGSVVRIADSFVDYTPRRQVYDPYKQKMVSRGGFKLKPLGWGVLGAGAIIGAARDTVSTFDNARIGARDPQIYRATPRIPAYLDNAGATGDLVFALNANRRG